MSINEKTNYSVWFRLAQFFFFAVFAFGLSTTSSDLAVAYNIPVSPMSLASVVFGGLGIIICEAFAVISKKW